MIFLGNVITVDAKRRAFVRIEGEGGIAPVTSGTRKEDVVVEVLY